MIRTASAVPAASSALALLVGCAADVPENVPLRGEWELVQTIDSVTVNGTLFGRDDLPEGLLELEGGKRVCGEPLYIDRDWQAGDLASRTKGQCTLNEYSHDSSSARFAGHCTVETPHATFNPKVTGHSKFTQTSSRDVVRMEGSIASPGSPQSDVLQIIAVQEGTRIGDC